MINPQTYRLNYLESPCKHQRGSKVYEGTNHLGNVLVTFSDKRLTECQEDTIYRYVADVKSQTDYSAFGVLLEERQWYSNSDTNSAIYGFNGMRKDDEIAGSGNYYDMGARLYDPRIGRTPTIDPHMGAYPHLSPYSSFANNPIIYIDPIGKDIVYFDCNGNEISELRVVTDKEFKTFVQTATSVVNGPIFSEAPMPNVIQVRPQKSRNEKVSDPKFQKNDYQLAASTFIINNQLKSKELIVVDKGGNVIPSSNLEQVQEIDVTLVKAWAMQESHVGINGPILQVNNKGDYTPDKKALGIEEGKDYTMHENINFAIRYAIGKGFAVSSVSYSDGGRTVNKEYEWKGWSAALKGYGPGSKDPEYQDKIYQMKEGSKPATPEDYKDK